MPPERPKLQTMRTDLDSQILAMIREGKIQAHISKALRVSTYRIKRVAAEHGITYTLIGPKRGRKPKTEKEAAYATCDLMLSEGYAEIDIVLATGLTADLVNRRFYKRAGEWGSLRHRRVVVDRLLFWVSRWGSATRDPKHELYRRCIDLLQHVAPVLEGSPAVIAHDRVFTHREVLQAILEHKFERARAVLHALALRHKLALYDPRLPQEPHEPNPHRKGNLQFQVTRWVLPDTDPDLEAQDQPVDEPLEPAAIAGECAD
jgi:hypothetical protein